MTVACGAYQKYHTKPSYSSLYKKPSTSHHDHTHFEEEEEEEGLHIFSLASS
jgi:hypothetical protein